MKGSISSIETFGLVDGPGIRCVVFLNGCLLRCKYCHNPEMWKMADIETTSDDLVKKILRSKPYFKRNNGGVTFSGGEPLLQINFLIEVCKKLKEHDIHIALDTSGVGIGKYEELLQYIDLVIFDVKHLNPKEYKDLVSYDIDKSMEFIEICKKLNKKFWIRQVIVPDIHDNIEYITELHKFVSTLSNVEKVEFLPYHKLGTEKYETLGLDNPYKNKLEMNKEKCNLLYEQFQKMKETI